MYTSERFIQRFLLEKFRVQFRKVDARRSENIVLDINKDCTAEQKRILVCYLDYGRSSYSLRHNVEHTNSQEMCQIIKVLIDMNFRIDVCDCANKEAIYEMPENYYDYIFGLGDLFWYAVEHNPEAFSILYMTENPYYISYQYEMERIQYFYKRTGKRIAFCRTGKFYHKDDEKHADAIICVGEKKYYDDIKNPVVRVFPSAFKNPYFENLFENRKKTNFLVLGVHGFVHKGNDLLMEVFQKHKEWNLYMCGTNIDKECRELGYKRTENIIDCGFVNTGSEKFCELLEKCTFVLLPSCSEGMSTGLMTCMRHGLIPVTMHGTGMDELEEYCLFFDDYFVENVERKLAEVVEMEDTVCNRLSKNIYEYANREFTLENYTKNIRMAFKELLAES